MSIKGQPWLHSTCSYSKTQSGGPGSVPISCQSAKHNGRTMQWFLKLPVRSDLHHFYHISLDEAGHKGSSCSNWVESKSLLARMGPTGKSSGKKRGKNNLGKKVKSIRIYILIDSVRKNKCICSAKDTNAHGSIVHSRRKLETAEMPIESRTDQKQWHIHSRNGSCNE